MVLQPSVHDAGTICVTSVTVPYSPDVPFTKRAQAWDLNKPVATPQVNVAAEQYNRIVRLVARGKPDLIRLGKSCRLMGLTLAATAQD